MNANIYLGLFAGVVVCFSLLSFIMFKKTYMERVRNDIQINITKDQMLQIENKLSKLKEDNNFNDDTDIYKIGQALNVYEGREKPFLGGRAHIESEEGTNRKIVDYSTRLSKEDRFYFFAHECGHVLNNDIIPNEKGYGRGETQEEHLADYVAEALLMPRNKLQTFMKQSDFYNLSAKKQRQIITSLCRTYCVSEITAIKRIREMQVLDEN